MNRRKQFWEQILGAILIVLIPATAAAESASRQVSAESLVGWLETYKKAWETRDADLAASLFTEDSSYQDNPYEEPHLGPSGIKSYWSGVTRDQRDIEFRYEVIGVTGDTGIAHWSARFAVANSDTLIELDGVFVLEFSSPDKCRRLREWWHLRSQTPAGADT